MSVQLAADNPQERILILEPGRAEKNYWRDLWRYRELFLILAWRDISVRYKQTIIGVAWAIIRPFLTMVVFSVIFGRLASLPKITEKTTIVRKGRMIAQATPMIVCL